MGVRKEKEKLWSISDLLSLDSVKGTTWLLILGLQCIWLQTEQFGITLNIHWILIEYTFCLQLTAKLHYIELENLAKQADILDKTLLLHICTFQHLSKLKIQHISLLVILFKCHFLLLFFWDKLLFVEATATLYS